MTVIIEKVKLKLWLEERYASGVKCRTLSLEVLGFSLSGSTGFFVGVSLGKILRSSSPVLVILTS